MGRREQLGLARGNGGALRAGVRLWKPPCRDVGEARVVRARRSIMKLERSALAVLVSLAAGTAWAVPPPTEEPSEWWSAVQQSIASAEYAGDGGRPRP